MIGYARI